MLSNFYWFILKLIDCLSNRQRGTVSDLPQHAEKPHWQVLAESRRLFTQFKKILETAPTFILDRKLRQGVLQSLKMLTTFMNNVQPHDLISAIDMFYAETGVEQLRYAVHCIVIALVRLLRMYCTSVLTDFTIQPLSGKHLCIDICVFSAT